MLKTSGGPPERPSATDPWSGVPCCAACVGQPIDTVGVDAMKPSGPLGWTSTKAPVVPGKSASEIFTLPLPLPLVVNVASEPKQLSPLGVCTRSSVYVWLGWAPLSDTSAITLPAPLL